jgi:glycosyltransferase involved in cell wall biosynthesis
VDQSTSPINNENLSNQPLVLIPAYNERSAVLQEVVEDWMSTGAGICIIDDASEPPVRFSKAGVTVIRHQGNMGQGAALRTGLAYGLTTSAAYFFTVDADGQHPATNASALLGPLLDDTADVVFGSRFLSPASARAVPLLRRLMLKLAVTFNNGITGLRMTDAHNGLRAMNRKAAATIRIREQRMAHASEIPLRTRQASLRWCEVAVKIRYTEYAVKKGQSIWRAFPISWQLIRLKWRNR